MLNFLIAPDFPPEEFAGWHLFNTQLQRILNTDIHLQMPADHTEQEQMLKQKNVGLVYADPFDASELVRNQGFLPVAQPLGRSDEMIIAAHAESEYSHSDQLKTGCKILITDNYDVQLLGLRLLESAGIGRNDIEWLHADSYPEAARRLIAKEADAAFFLSSAYRSFRQNTLDQLKSLMESRINDLSHIVLLHPDHADKHALIQQAFTEIGNTPAGKMVLQDLNMAQGFKALTQEEAEFMIDIIETLQD